MPEANLNAAKKQASGRRFSLSLSLAISAALLLGTSTVLIFYDLIQRRLFSRSLNGLDEAVGLLFAVAMSFGLAYTIQQQGHVRILLFVDRAPEGFKLVAKAVANLFFAFFLLLLAGQSVYLVVDAFHLNAKTNNLMSLPLWIPMSAWLLGLAIAALVAIAEATSTLWSWFSHDRVRKSWRSP